MSSPDQDSLGKRKRHNGHDDDSSQKRTRGDDSSGNQRHSEKSRNDSNFDEKKSRDSLPSSRDNKEDSRRKNQSERRESDRKEQDRKKRENNLGSSNHQKSSHEDDRKSSSSKGRSRENENGKNYNRTDSTSSFDNSLRDSGWSSHSDSRNSSSYRDEGRYNEMDRRFRERSPERFFGPNDPVYYPSHMNIAPSRSEFLRTNEPYPIGFPSRGVDYIPSYIPRNYGGRRSPPLEFSHSHSYSTGSIPPHFVRIPPRSPDRNISPPPNTHYYKDIPPRFETRSSVPEEYYRSRAESGGRPLAPIGFKDIPIEMIPPSSGIDPRSSLGPNSFPISSFHYDSSRPYSSLPPVSSHRRSVSPPSRGFPIREPLPPSGFPSSFYPMNGMPLPHGPGYFSPDNRTRRSPSPRSNRGRVSPRSHRSPHRSPVRSPHRSPVRSPHRDYSPNRDNDDQSRFYKTKLCKFWSVGECKGGSSCRFAHGDQELKR